MQLALPPRGTPRPCGERTSGTSGTPARQHTHEQLMRDARTAGGAPPAGGPAPVSRLAAPLRLDGRASSRTTPTTSGRTSQLPDDADDDAGRTASRGERE